jgi:hypothetical protein
MPIWSGNIFALRQEWLRRQYRTGGRVVECAGLEIRYTVLPYREFESHPVRHKIKDLQIIQATRNSGFYYSLQGKFLSIFRN